MPIIEINRIAHPSLKDLDPEVISKLKESIDGQGLRHEITIRKIETEPDQFELIAGKKRLRACIDLGLKTIPAQILECPKDEAIEIALHENLRRHNLPWYEEVELELELHNRRLMQHGEKVLGRPRISNKPQGWSMADTARELGKALGTTSQDLMLATVVKLNPHLRKVADKTTAIRLARQISKREEAEAYALMPVEDNEEPILNQVLLGDSLQVLKSMPSQFFNACITDPPWVEYKDAELTSDSSTLPIFEEVYRVLAYDSAMYMVVSTPDFYMYLKELPKFGFVCQEWPLIWHKKGAISHGHRGWEHWRDYEPILLAAKGNPILSKGTGVSSVLTHPPIRPVDLRHPHEKPSPLIEQLLEYCTYSGSKVLDPFGGSGVLLEACSKLDRKYTIIERNKKFYDNIVKRQIAISSDHPGDSSQGSTV